LSLGCANTTATSCITALTGKNLKAIIEEFYQAEQARRPRARWSARGGLQSELGQRQAEVANLTKAITMGKGLGLDLIARRFGSIWFSPPLLRRRKQARTSTSSSAKPPGPGCRLKSDGMRRCSNRCP
jgi:hypothetical protein